MKGIWTYSKLLPAPEEQFQVTLGEGNTPLLKSKRIGPGLGLEHLYFKLETVNPTGSYKDRFAASAVSHLLQQGAGFCIATSSGNTGSALAAYCASVNIPCFLILVDGVPSGKLRQMQIYGAKTIVIRDFGKSAAVTEKVFSHLHTFTGDCGIGVQISAYKYSALGMSGVATIAYEIAQELRDEKIQVFSPAGGGGLTLAMIKGFGEWKKAHKEYCIPQVHCIQPEGNNTIAGSLEEGLSKAKKIDKSTTVVSGLQVPDVIDGDQVITGCRSVGGHGYLVTDELVYACQGDLARMEGIYCEPAGAVGFAGLLVALKEGTIKASDPIVCLVTGHGFKDPDSVSKLTSGTPEVHFDDVTEVIQYFKAHI